MGLLTGKKLSFFEFLTLMASMMALVALAVDAYLPAQAEIVKDFQLKNENDGQYIISIIFLGLAFGQLIFGPLSDSLGRKPAMAYGYLVFFAGSYMSLTASGYGMMIAGRLMQGVGLASPRAVCMAIIRDQEKGDHMARIMSFIMVVFILVPMIAPAMGQAILKFFHWRMIFLAIFIVALITLVWFYLRQEETLPKDKRIPFKGKNLMSSAVMVLRDRNAMIFTLAAGLTSSPFIAYLSLAQQIFGIQYGLGELFPLYFAGLALSLGIASFINGKIVLKYGMGAIVNKALYLIIITGAVSIPLSIIYKGHPPLVMLTCIMVLILFSTGLLFGNLNSMAMESLGKTAGMGSAIVGFLSSVVTVPIAVGIGQLYDNDVFYLLLGFLIFAVTSLIMIDFFSGKNVIFK